MKNKEDLSGGHEKREESRKDSLCDANDKKFCAVRKFKSIAEYG